MVSLKQQFRDDLGADGLNLSKSGSCHDLVYQLLAKPNHQTHQFLKIYIKLVPQSLTDPPAVREREREFPKARKGWGRTGVRSFVARSCEKHPILQGALAASGPTSLFGEPGLRVVPRIFFGKLFGGMG